MIPIINDYWEQAEFPFELIPKLARLGIAGGTIRGYGWPEMSPVAAGLVGMELSRGDGSVSTFSASTPALRCSRSRCWARPPSARIGCPR